MSNTRQKTSGVEAVNLRMRGMLNSPVLLIWGKGDGTFWFFKVLLFIWLYTTLKYISFTLHTILRHLCFFIWQRHITGILIKYIIFHVSFLFYLMCFRCLICSWKIFKLIVYFINSNFIESHKICVNTCWPFIAFPWAYI